MRRPRISAISYLNTAPLMWDFEHGIQGAGFDFSYTVPSQCAAQLGNGSTDIGIVPVAAYATVSGLAILPGVAIASRGAVRSILLVSNVGLDDIRTVALDNSSLTSTALTRLLFEKWWGGGRTFVNRPPDLAEMLAHNDAALLIGDPALKIDRSLYRTYDLAEEWANLTGKPFVFAFWAVRKAAVEEFTPYLDLAAIFRQSRDHGLQPENLGQIVKEWSTRLGLEGPFVHSYLTRNIYYSLDAGCLEGLNLFYRYAAECGLLPPVDSVKLLDTSHVLP